MCRLLAEEKLGERENTDSVAPSFKLKRAGIGLGSLTKHEDQYLGAVLARLKKLVFPHPTVAEIIREAIFHI